jgi:polysaccharide biosynthesis/export protein
MKGTINATHSKTHMVSKILWTVGLLLVLTLAVRAQDRAPAVPQVSSPEYQLGPGDSISVGVFGVPQFDHTTRISNSGKIHVPYLGTLQVSHRTVSQAEQDIAARIREKNLVSDPWVRVRVEEYRAQPVYVIGEVMTPGQFVITDQMYLLDVVSKAGGLSANADSVAFLYRMNLPLPPPSSEALPQLTSSVQATDAAQPKAHAPDSASDATRISISDLMAGKRPDMNLRLQAGDILYIPRRLSENFFIVGGVTFPGVYTLPRTEPLTAARAVSYAGGPLRTAKTGGALVVRRNAQGAREELPFDFNAVLRGEKPDVTLQAWDIVFIPGSTAKTVGFGLLDLVGRLPNQLIIF